MIRIGKIAILLVAVLGATRVFAAEHCCAVVSVNPATKVVTIQAKAANKAAFEVTLADAAALRKVAKGQPVSLNGSDMTLLLHLPGAAPTSVKVTNVRYVSAGQSAGSGAVASAASSSSNGIFRRDGPTRGVCPPIKETSTQQCVLTHDNTSSGRGCEYYCVPIPNR